MTARLPATTRSGFRAAAPAKINLYLHVVGRRAAAVDPAAESSVTARGSARADGYHLLDSLVAFADVHDTVTAVEGDGLSLKLEGPFGAALTAEPDNLVLRAARGLADLGGVEPRARLRLIKRLPVASGIGGGSADAAAALRVLAALWKLRPAAGDLNKLALALGADVPVCLGGRAVYMGGIGEKLAPAPALPPAGLVLVNPGVPLSTPPVFKARTGPFSGPARFVQAPRDARALARLLEERRNDLSAPAIGLVPAIDRILAALARCEGCLLARMSGSGATCFGLFADRAAAARAAQALAGAEPGWWVAAGDLVGDISKVQPSI